MIGTEEQLERIKTSFRESVFGPAPENLFFEEDITPERRAEGYWVDFLAERGSWLSKVLDHLDAAVIYFTGDNR